MGLFSWEREAIKTEEKDLKRTFEQRVFDFRCGVFNFIEYPFYFAVKIYKFFKRDVLPRF